MKLEVEKLIKEIRQEQRTWDCVGPYKTSYLLFDRCIEQLEKLSMEASAHRATCTVNGVGVSGD